VAQKSASVVDAMSAGGCPLDGGEPQDEARVARDYILQLGKRLRSLGGEREVQDMPSGSTLKDTMSFCDAALAALSQHQAAARDGALYGRRAEAQSEYGGDAGRTILCASVITSVDVTAASENECGVCGAAVGKLRLNPRHHCRICGAVVCGACSSMERACTPCIVVARQEGLVRERLTHLSEKLRVAVSGGETQVREQLDRPLSLEEAMSACEASLGPLLESRRAARLLGEEAARYAEACAQAAKEASSIFEARIASLSGGHADGGRGEHGEDGDRLNYKGGEEEVRQRQDTEIANPADSQFRSPNPAESGLEARPDAQAVAAANPADSGFWAPPDQDAESLDPSEYDFWRAPCDSNNLPQRPKGAAD